MRVGCAFQDLFQLEGCKETFVVTEKRLYNIYLLEPLFPEFLLFPPPSLWTVSCLQSHLLILYRPTKKAEGNRKLLIEAFLNPM